MGFGTSFGTLFGGGSFGLSAGTAFGIVSAIASSNRSVIVTFSTPPLVGYSPIDLTSAVNPRNWTVQDLDSGVVFTVLSARSLAVLPNSIELALLTPYDRQVAAYQVGVSSTVLSASLSPLTGATTATFSGAAWVQQNTPMQTLSDIQNPQVPNPTAGSFIVGSNGDYAHESGAALVRKLILRRIITVLGGFKHLTTYGEGVSVKGFYSAGQLVKMQNDIQTGVRLEPEVQDASVTVSLAVGDQLTINIQAKLRSGSTLSVGYTPQKNAVQL